ncbi:expressed protein [Chlorella variabilis]|uniref:Expressed protein n=1 Tax=Chlorella variabilis TaxID=554065 RepID=E1ZLN3_CHLVA|nr:expressed protein [Chlorella variabilis]EFN53296.1 expressed protein [Chlorella variabilis]|eukprot:XP_005845398.1 expressed protein [Chlorella variabilis]
MGPTDLGSGRYSCAQCRCVWDLAASQPPTGGPALFIPPLNSTAATGLNPACPAVTLDGSAFTAAVPNCTSPNPPTIAVFNEGIHGVVVMSQAACTLESYFWANSFQIKSASLNVSLAAFLVGFTGAGLNASSAISWAFSGGGTGANRTASLAPGAALPTTRQLRLRLNTPAPLLLTNGSGVRVSMVGGVADGYIDGAYQLIRYLYSFQRGTCSWQLASAAAGGSVAAAAAGCPRVTLGSPYRACGSPPGVSGGLVGGGMRLYLNTTLGCIPEGAFSSVNLTAGGVDVLLSQVNITGVGTALDLAQDITLLLATADGAMPATLAGGSLPSPAASASLALDPPVLVRAGARARVSVDAATLAGGDAAQAFVVVGALGDAPNWANA